jgi:hypothetical protein
MMFFLLHHVQRKSTLLKEYEQLGKANKFVDQRIGEKDKSLSREDKALQRFQKERQVRHYSPLPYASSSASPSFPL